MKKILLTVFLTVLCLSVFADEPQVKGIPAYGKNRQALVKSGGEEPIHNYDTQWLEVPANSLLCTDNEADVLQSIPKSAFAGAVHTHKFSDVITDDDHEFISKEKKAEIATALSNSSIAKSTSERAISEADKADEIAKEADKTSANALTVANGVDAKASRALSDSAKALGISEQANKTANGISATATSSLVISIICIIFFLACAVMIIILLNQDKVKKKQLK